MFNLLSEATQTTGYGMYIILGVMLLLFIAFFVYSNYTNKKRQKEAEDKMNSIRVGDRVKTIGGICGIVVEVNDEENTFVLETGVDNSGSFIKFDKVAMYQINHKEEEKPETAETETAETPSETPAESEETSSVPEENGAQTQGAE